MLSLSEGLIAMIQRNIQAISGMFQSENPVGFKFLDFSNFSKILKVFFPSKQRLKFFIGKVLVFSLVIVKYLQSFLISSLRYSKEIQAPNIGKSKTLLSFAYNSVLFEAYSVISYRLTYLKLYWDYDEF